MATKLDSGQKHFLKLIARDQQEPVFRKVLPELPKPSKVRRQIRRNGGFDMVPAYTEEEMYRYGEQCAAFAQLRAIPGVVGNAAAVPTKVGLD
jgi:hypothetical protein